MRGVFVTGTDTEVGKTVLAGAICAALVARGERVRRVTAAIPTPHTLPAKLLLGCWLPSTLRSAHALCPFEQRFHVLIREPCC